MKEKNFTLEFGKKYRVGNFYVLKVNKVLRKSEVAQMRNQLGIPEDIRKSLMRAQLPCIKVCAISGIWSVEYACNTQMYMFIDRVFSEAYINEQRGIKSEYNTVADFLHFFTMFFTDTTVLGDSIYTADKANALKAFMERQKALKGQEETAEEKRKDDEILNELKQNEETKAIIVDMASALKKGGKDGK